MAAGRMTGERQRPRLEISGISITFGGIRALNDISLEVLPKQIVGIIGPNGAGKTTAFNVITGAYRPGKGEVRLDGHAVTAEPSHRIARAGISRTFQNIRLFGDMTVWEHLLVAQPHNEFALRRLLPTRWANPQALRRAEEILELLKLGDVKHRIARSLPYGVQRRVEIARAVIARPKLLLLDEPVAGMNHDEADEIRRLMLELRAGGLSILLVEHDMAFVMNLCDYLYVLDFGVMIAQGRPAEIRSNATVLDAYLGHTT
jgi:branched-chain amino acid transport system ATP-binding protein